MSLVSDSELAAVQAVAEEGMDSRATILTQATVETPDGQESVWATSALDIPCWVYQQTPIGGTLGAIAGAVGISQTFSIRFPIGTAIGSGDHIVVGSELYVAEQTNAESTIAPWLVVGARNLE